MLTWILVNTGLTLLALAFIRLNGTAPHRLRFCAGIVALAAWLVPWSWLPGLLPNLLPTLSDLGLGLARMEHVVDAGSAQLTGVTPIVVQTSGVPLVRDFLVFTVVELAFSVLCLTGAALFLWNLGSHHYRLRRLAQRSRDGNWLWQRAGLDAECPLVVQREIAGAFSSGLWRPRIWVNADLVASEQLPTLLRHELTHIRQHDNWYLLLITLVEKLFWWNPLVWYLGCETRELQELSCDEACQRSIGDYATRLAQLMLDSARLSPKPRLLALSANIFNKPNPNIKRIKLLESSYVMKTRHIASAVLTAVTAALGVGLVTAQPEVVQGVAGERVSALRLERAPGSDDDVLFVRNTVLDERIGRTARGVVKIEEVNGEKTISLSFTDRPLTGVLMQLVGFVSPGGIPPKLAGVAVVRALDEDAEATHELSTGELIEAVEAAGGAARWGEEMRVVSFSPRFVVDDRLVLEYPGAANRLVTVSAVNVTVDELIDLIAEASGCNIFQDGDRIVVDWCEAQ